MNTLFTIDIQSAIEMIRSWIRQMFDLYSSIVFKYGSDDDPSYISFLWVLLSLMFFEAVVVKFIIGSNGESD